MSRIVWLVLIGILVSNLVDVKPLVEMRSLGTMQPIANLVDCK